MSSNERYFNAPISLYRGFLVNAEQCLNDVVDYAIFAHAQKLGHGSVTERIKSAATYFNVTLGSVPSVIKNGESLYLFHKGPKTGIKVNTLWQFLCAERGHDDVGPKSEFEKVCLLVHLAIRSIVQNKPYFKLDNKFWLARMDGRAKSCPLNELSPEIRKYANEYQTKKIKKELVNSWGLRTYSYYTRGFYVSYSLTENELMCQAEKNRRARKDKARSLAIAEARRLVLLRLDAEQDH